MRDLERMLESYRLTTAEIIYRLPDHPIFLQTYVWQDLDLAPDFPILKKFLYFWEHSLDGALHSVKIASCQLIKPSELRFCKGEFYLH